MYCNHFHHILRFLMFYQIFFSPQVKRSAIITHKHCFLRVASQVTERLAAGGALPTQEKKRLKILGN